MRPRPIAETLMSLAPSVRISMAAPQPGGGGQTTIIARPARAEEAPAAAVSKEIEVLAVLPVAHFEVVAADFRLLDAAVVVDERLAVSRAQHLVFAQRLQRFAER